jgi:hypothetical protein
MLWKSFQKFCISYAWEDRQTDSHGEAHSCIFFNFLLYTPQKQILYMGICSSDSHGNVLRK